MRTFKTLKDVVDWGMCTGCGACSYACPTGSVSLINIDSVGIRPQFTSDGCGQCTECLHICPGAVVDARPIATQRRPSTDGDHAFGPAMEIWEGYAASPSLRHRASSGGILTALAMYCLEHEEMDFVLHTAMDERQPWANKTVVSRTSEELTARSGSRYAPSSPCDGLEAIERSDAPCVFIGKPCDVAAVAQLRLQKPALDRNLGLVLTFFCAGTPSSQGTRDLAKSMKISSASIDSLRYRGHGWPGDFSILHDQKRQEDSLSYNDSWSYLTHYRSLRCNLCPDGLGRLGDISCGDAWQHSSADGNPGLSLILVRTPRGQRILRGAMDHHYVDLRPAGTSEVFAAQSSLLRRRKELFGRLAALKLFGIPTPRYHGFSLIHSWMQLSLAEKGRTVAGTARRIFKRALYRKASPLQTQASAMVTLSPTVVQRHIEHEDVEVV